MSQLGIFNGPKKKPHAYAPGVRHRGVRGLGAAPGQYWKDSRVLTMQTQLNGQLSAAGCTTVLKTDGLIGAGTCGALAWSKSNGSPPAAYMAASKDMDAGCAVFKTFTAPSCAAAVFTEPMTLVPAPTAAPPPAALPPNVVPVAPITHHGPIVYEPPHRAKPAAPAAALAPMDLGPLAPAPASSSTGMSMGLKIGIGAAAVALVGFAVFAKSKTKKAA